MRKIVLLFVALVYSYIANSQTIKISLKAGEISAYNTSGQLRWKLSQPNSFSFLRGSTNAASSYTITSGNVSNTFIYQSVSHVSIEGGDYVAPPNADSLARLIASKISTNAGITGSSDSIAKTNELLRIVIGRQDSAIKALSSILALDSAATDHLNNLNTRGVDAVFDAGDQTSFTNLNNTLVYELFISAYDIPDSENDYAYFTVDGKLIRLDVYTPVLNFPYDNIKPLLIDQVDISGGIKFRWRAKTKDTN